MQLSTPGHPEVGDATQDVSILIRPEGRMQPTTTDGVAKPPGFNPHPARRPDATCALVILIRPERQADHVSILIRPEGRMQRFQSSSGQKAGCNVAAEGHRPVSILIRPEGRMQPFPTWMHPRRTGCFNPHPARRPDATAAGRRSLSGPAVSILIRPEGRMQHPKGPLQRHAVAVFQSSSGQKAGCNIPRSRTCPAI